MMCGGEGKYLGGWEGGEVNVSGDDVDRLSFTHLDDLNKCSASLLYRSICK